MGAPTIFTLSVSPSSRWLEIPPTPKARRDAVSFRIVDAKTTRPDGRSRPWRPKDKDRPPATVAMPGR